MPSGPDPYNLVAVLGPTASGKSGLAEYLAAEFSGELLNADASAVFEELSVGVTKPPAAVRKKTPYHLLDIATLEQGFSLIDYLAQANLAMEQVSRRGKLPIVVGGSGLYTRALLDGYMPPEIPIPETVRNYVRSLEASEAQAELRDKDPEAYQRIDQQNPRRVSRALELTLAAKGPVPPPKRHPRKDLRILRFYLLPQKSLLLERIQRRTQDMWEPWLEEVDQLEKKGLAHWLDLRKPIGYSSVLAYIRGEISRDEAVDLIVSQTVKLAKKQKTWLKREGDHPFSYRFTIDHEEQWSQVPEVAGRQLRQFLS